MASDLRLPTVLTSQFRPINVGRLTEDVHRAMHLPFLDAAQSTQMEYGEQEAQCQYLLQTNSQQWKSGKLFLHRSTVIFRFVSSRQIRRAWDVDPRQRRVHKVQLQTSDFG